MRIAIFTDHFYPELGGIQDSICTSVRELGIRGHTIRVFAPAAAERDFRRSHQPTAEPELGPNVSVRRLLSWPLHSSSQQSRLVIPTGRCRREFAAFQPDLIHTHSFMGVGLEALWSARRLNVPLVGTNHWAIGAFDLYAPLARGLFRKLSSRAVVRYYQHCDYVTGPSKFTLSDMQASGLNRPCAVISNPIDTRVFRAAPASKKLSLKSRLGLAGHTIVYAGRLAREKRLDVLIRAVALVRKTQSDVALVLVGHGSHRRKLQALAQSLGIDRQVYFAGTLAHAELAGLLSGADLFAISSTSETQSMSLLQAMACGLPVVGVRCGGLMEYIPASVGLQAEPGCPYDLSQKLQHMLESQPLREAMGRRARRFAMDFSVASIADTWENTYQHLIHRYISEHRLLSPKSHYHAGNETCT